MTQRTLPHSRPATNRPEAHLAVGAILLLTGLIVADRAVAWLIGQFPSVAALWQLRFEYLRPAGVFYDIAAINLGPVSVSRFSVIVLLCGLVVALCAVSRIRVARAVAYHVLLGVALALTVFSLGPSAGVYSMVGAPSALYVTMGLLLSVSAAILCLLIHAEYVGWAPRLARLRRRIAAYLARQLSDLRHGDLPRGDDLQPALARVRGARERVIPR